MTLEHLNTEIITCCLCPRLVTWREKVAQEKRCAYRDWEYWGKPVPGFGDPRAGVMVVGLAPGAHGSNRTGRMFTGDASGDFLYPALYRAGFASQPDSRHRDDGLTLKNLYITAVCRCAPPGNKPLPDEMDNCQPYLEQEIELIHSKVIVALGRMAFERILRIHSAHAKATDDRPQTVISRPSSMVFAHGAVYQLVTGNWLLCSYHPSQQNTRTGRLTAEMFDAVWQCVHDLLPLI